MVMSVQPGIFSLMPESEEERLSREIENLRTRVAEQAAEIARLQELAETDAVTGIANRRSFDREIRRRLLEQQRDGRGFSLVIIDIDDFKAINDRFGHTAGDRLLQTFASAVSRNLRGSDIVARVGGDEFGIILPGAGQDQAGHAVQRLLHDTREVLQSENHGLPVGISAGVCQAAPGMTVEQIIDLADRAMYRAKELGGNRFVIASE